MTWDVERYLAFERERTRPARDLLAAVEVAEPSRVLDVGVGPGNSTALLAKRWPGAHLSGIDSSAAMLAAARARVPSAEFVEADAVSFEPQAPYDVVFSNAVLQWIPSHETMIPKMFSWLKPGGVLAIQMPCNDGDPSHVLLRHIGRAGMWAEKCAPFVGISPVGDRDFYYDLLSRYAPRVDIWETQYVHVLDGPEGVVEWMRGTRLAPMLAVLGDEKEAFLRMYGEAIESAYPRQRDGKVLFPFRRLFMSATTSTTPTVVAQSIRPPAV